MLLVSPSEIDFSFLWVFIMFFARFGGLFTSLPGVGTEQVSTALRIPIVLVFAAVTSLTGLKVPEATNVIQGALMISGEFLIGYLLGLIPSFIISALAVTGQVTAGAIGIGQAAMIDPSLGESVSVLARVESLLATALFLLIDGHHIIIKAATGVGHDVALGTFRPDSHIALLLIERFADSFVFAMTIAAPVLSTILVTQFVFGLITKFVPTINIFIMSLPVTIGMGLYMIAFSLPELTTHLIEQYREIQEVAARVVSYAANQ